MIEKSAMVNNLGPRQSSLQCSFLKCAQHGLSAKVSSSQNHCEPQWNLNPEYPRVLHRLLYSKSCKAETEPWCGGCLFCTKCFLPPTPMSPLHRPTWWGLSGPHLASQEMGRYSALWPMSSRCGQLSWMLAPPGWLEAHSLSTPLHWASCCCKQRDNQVTQLLWSHVWTFAKMHVLWQRSSDPWSWSRCACESSSCELIPAGCCSDNWRS